MYKIDRRGGGGGSKNRSLRQIPINLIIWQRRKQGGNHECKQSD